MKQKKFFRLVLWSLVMLSLTACTPVETTTSVPDPTSLPEYLQDPLTTQDGKEVLRLEDYRNAPIAVNYEEGSVLNTKSIDLPHAVLPEREEAFYKGEKEFDILVQYIRDTLHTTVNDRWKVWVHYYDGEKTVGMVQFVYTVGEINTNRSIVFNINGNKYDTVYYKCLTETFQESNLTQRVNHFKDRYVQGKRDLQDGESFYEEKTAYTYFIHTDVLVYSYAFFFQYGGGVVNNDWGTECIIDQQGYALVPFSFESDKLAYPQGEPGVKTGGFVNSTPISPIAGYADAVEQAQKECTATYDAVSVAWDFSAKIWRVDFYTAGIVGGGQSVYLDSEGITQRIVWGE